MYSNQHEYWFEGGTSYGDIPNPRRYGIVLMILHLVHYMHYSMLQQS